MAGQGHTGAAVAGDGERLGPDSVRGQLPRRLEARGDSPEWVQPLGSLREQNGCRVYVRAGARKGPQPESRFVG